MKKLYGYFLAIALCSAAFASVAQEVSPVAFMRMNPYQMKANPAADLPYEKVLSLVIGNYGVGLQNSTLRYDNLFDFDAQGRPTVFNMRKFANSLKEDNYLGANANIDLFTYYCRLNTGMLTVNYGVKAQSDAKYGKDLFKLLGYGNSAFVGNDNPAMINLNVNASVYQELAVGYQLDVTEQLSVGGRAKLLFGFGNIRTEAFDVRLYTDADSYALRVEENVAMKAAAPSAVYVDDQGQLLVNGPFNAGELFRNPGFGLDLGAEYRFDERFSAVAAVHDLGFIHWGLNRIGMQGQIHDAGQFYDDGGFLFDGMDADQLQRVFSDQGYREQFLDTLQQYFQVQFSPVKAYNTMLNTNLLLRGNFDLDPNNRFSLQAQGRFCHSGFRPALTLAYSGSFFEMLDVCATYSMMKGSYDNIGLGLAGNFRSFHIYMATNNLLGLFKPLNASAMSAEMGIVFNLRLPQKETRR